MSFNIAPPDGSYRYMQEHLLYFRFTKTLFGRGTPRVQLIADLWNVLQDEAVNSIITRNFFSATFARPAAWIQPRKLDLSARVVF